MEINFDGNKITLSSEYAGTATPWSENYIKQHHIVKVCVNGTDLQFDYYCNDTSLTDTELANALYCSLSDAMYYADATDIDDFAETFGYTKVSECLKAYNGCKDEYNNWMKTSINIHEFADYLQSEYSL